MTSSPNPPVLPEVDRTADERATLVQMLDFYRAVLLRKTWGLSDAQLASSLPPSELTLGGILLHMALVEDSWFDHRFLGNDEVEPWAGAPWDDDRDWEFHVAKEWKHADLVSQFEGSVARSQAAVASADTLNQLAVRTAQDGARWSLRWILVHMIEEYARHCGHADLIRQSIDGAVGD